VLGAVVAGLVGSPVARRCHVFADNGYIPQSVANLADARSRERSHSGAGACEWLWMYPFSLAIVAGVFALAPRDVRQLGFGHRR
jgi:hypothetical protein